MLVLLLGGCIGSVVLDGAPDEVRTAWVLEIDGAPRARAFVVGNSALPCGPDETSNDPATPVDDAAAAVAWWNAQISAAFYREGAILTAFVVADPDSAWAGDYRLDGTRGADPLAAALSPDRLGIGMYWVVYEATGDPLEDLSVTQVPTEFEAALFDGVNGTLHLDPPVADRWRGEFDFDAIDLHGTFRAAPCDDATLRAVLLARLIAGFVLPAE
jgi:hypothetical protein